MTTIQFTAPPMPHYIISNEDTYPKGGSHAARAQIGVFDLLVVTRGCLYLMEEETPYRLSAGHYLLLRPDKAHHTEMPCSEETHFYWLHFQSVGQWSEVTEVSTFVTPHLDDPYIQMDYFSFYIPRLKKLNMPAEVYELLHQLNLLAEQPFSHSRWRQQVLFQELLLKLQEEGANELENPYILVAEQAAAYLRQNYKDSVSYEELSRTLHFHPNYIARCMKRVFHCTPLEFLTRYRIDQAKLLLIHTNQSIGLIAEKTGFGSFPYFIRCFSKRTGLSPRAFRQKFRS
jgi:AraC-like DNA-binding protein